MKKNPSPLYTCLFALLLLPTLLCARTFEIEDVRYTLDFSDYALDSNLGQNGWLNNNQHTQTVKVVTPSGTGSSVDQVARFDATSTRRSAYTTAGIDTMPDFELGDTMFLSAEIYAKDLGHSGVTLSLRNSQAEYLASLRVSDVAPKRWSMRGISGDYLFHENEQDRVMADNWYEVLLAIQIHDTDVTLSTGSLFFRDLTAGETEFQAVGELQNVNLGFTSTQNILEIGQIRYDYSRGEAELGNIRIGTGAVIPEPGQIAFLFGAAVLSGALLMRKRRK